MHEIEESMKDPLFCVDLAMRYHSRRWGFLNHVETWVLFLSSLVPFVMLFVWQRFMMRPLEDGSIRYPWLVVILAMCYMVVWLFFYAKTSKEDPWTRTKFSRRYRDTKRKFGDVQLILRCSSNADDVSRARFELARLLHENPFRLRVLLACTYNECLTARGEVRRYLYIKWWQVFFSQWFDIHANRIVPVV